MYGVIFFFFNDTATTEIYTLSLHDALPICHLANDPQRDPDFDAGLPQSPFQEIVSWRVPNTRTYGGTNRHLSRRACRRHRHGGYVHFAGGHGTHRAVSVGLSRRAVRTARKAAKSHVALGARVIGERQPVQ